MDTAIEVWEGEGGACGCAASNQLRSARRRGALWTVVLFVIATIVGMAFVVKLN